MATFPCCPHHYSALQRVRRWLPFPAGPTITVPCRGCGDGYLSLLPPPLQCPAEGAEMAAVLPPSPASTPTQKKGWWSLLSLETSVSPPLSSPSASASIPSPSSTRTAAVEDSPPQTLPRGSGGTSTSTEQSRNLPSPSLPSYFAVSPGCPSIGEPLPEKLPVLTARGVLLSSSFSLSISCVPRSWAMWTPHCLRCWTSWVGEFYLMHTTNVLISAHCVYSNNAHHNGSLHINPLCNDV